MKITLLGIFKKIKNLKIADNENPTLTVKDVLPFMCSKIEKGLEEFEQYKKLMKKYGIKDINALEKEITKDYSDIKDYRFEVYTDYTDFGDKVYVTRYFDVNVIGAGDTIGEVIKEAHGNLEVYLDCCKEKGISIPEPSKYDSSE